MLLIFFLVATTMDVDTGLARMLPPPVPEDQPKQENEIKDRNVLVVLVNKNNQILCDGKWLTVSQLREETKEFISNPRNNEELPEFNELDIDLIGTYSVSKGVISLQNDRGTAYKTYIEVQNELVGAYNELRDELSMSKFRKKFDDLSEEQSEAVKKAIPQRISEAEPKNVGGK
jgi:biopolymer transport protein ExbD